MATTGQAVFTVTAGVPSAVTITGTTITDGTYTIDVNQDNSGTVLACNTPYGAAQNSSIRPVQSTDS
jgi:hypothetical protein